MNLLYKILWVEDSTDFLESFDKDEMEEYVALQGFDLEVEYRTDPDDITREVKGEEYDLLIIDYNIAESGGVDGQDLHGDDVIRQVRRANCLTEVIFYSTDAPSTLRRLASEKELDGVFFSSREHLLSKIKSVFDLTIRKVIDVENMRGIVMAGVADLDHLMSDIVLEVHRNMDEGRQVELCRKILSKMKPSLSSLKKLVRDGSHANFKEVESLLGKIVDLDPVDIENLITSRIFDSHKRVEITMGLCGGNLEAYKADVEGLKALLKWRNALAHQKSIKGEDNIYRFQIEEGEASAFDAQQTLALRQQLRTGRGRLSAMLAALNITA